MFEIELNALKILRRPICDTSHVPQEMQIPQAYTIYTRTSGSGTLSIQALQQVASDLWEHVRTPYTPYTP